MKWSEKISVDTHDTDCQSVVRISPILRYMQHAADMQMRTLGPSNEELWDEGKAFILSKLAMSVYAPLYAGDEIEVQSWAAHSKGVSHNRCSRILRYGEIVAESISVFALIDRKTKHLLKVSDFHPNFPPEDILELDVPSRIRIPDSINLSLMGERLTVYSDLDRNQHINNTRYPDILCDYLPKMNGRRVETLSINFIHEATLGQTLKIYHAEADEVSYFRLVNESGVTTLEAEMVLDEIK